jgi:hypothetical protein
MNQKKKKKKKKYEPWSLKAPNEYLPCSGEYDGFATRDPSRASSHKLSTYIYI